MPSVRPWRRRTGSLQERLAPRTVVIEQDASCEALYALLEGTVEVFSGFDEQETVIDVVGPGSVLLLACVVAAIPYIASVRTLSPGRILAVPAPAVQIGVPAGVGDFVTPRRLPSRDSARERDEDVPQGVSPVAGRRERRH